MKQPPNSILFQLDVSLRHLVYQLMETVLGKDPHYCEGCERHFAKKLTIHHKRYNGATIYDLAFFCMSCQNKPVNKGLA